MINYLNFINLVNIMKLNINLLDLAKISKNRLYIELDKDYLKYILSQASKDSKPHRNLKLVSSLDLKIAPKAKLSTTIYSWMNYNKALPLNKLNNIIKLSGLSWEEVENNVKSLKVGYKGKEVFIDFPVKIDRELGSIIGHILGDGSIDRKYQQVFYSNSNKELLKEFSRDMKKIFQIKPRIWMQKTSTFEGKTRWEKRLNKINELKKNRNCGLFYPTTCGVILNYIFNNFAIGKTKIISKEIMNTNKEFKEGLIRAFYDDEGTVEEGNIRIFQDKNNILEAFKMFLKEFGIITGKVKTYNKKNKDRCYLDIHRKSNFIKFQKEIGFTSTKKKQKLKNITIIKNYQNSK